MKLASLPGRRVREPRVRGQPRRRRAARALARGRRRCRRSPPRTTSRRRPSSSAANGDYDIRWMTPDERDRPLRPRDARLGVGRLQPPRDRPAPRSPSARRAAPLRVRRRRRAARPRLPVASRRSRPGPVRSQPSPRRSAARPPACSPRATTSPSSRARTRCARSRPTWRRVAALDRMAVIATAPGRDCDFVSRFFAPAVGVPEDPVTGSAHCTLVPYWSRRLGPGERCSRGRSRRGAASCGARTGATRVSIAGRAALYLRGRSSIDG